MISTFTIVAVLLALIPTIPLALYVIGLFIPSSHIVSRSHKYNTTPSILWAILTSIEDYPAWRSNIDRVTVRHDDFESDLNKYEDESRITFVEYTKKDRRTVVMHIEQEVERKLLRVLEERPSYIIPGVNDQDNQKISTFSGSWAFQLTPTDDNCTILKITEQGVIKKPMVRVSHMLFFGYHRRIDRFIKDLGKEIDLGFLQEPKEEEEEQDNSEEDEEYEVGPDDSVIHTNTLTESKMIEKEWDML